MTQIEHILLGISFVFSLINFNYCKILNNKIKEIEHKMELIINAQEDNCNITKDLISLDEKMLESFKYIISH